MSIEQQEKPTFDEEALETKVLKESLDVSPERSAKKQTEQESLKKTQATFSIGSKNKQIMQKINSTQEGQKHSNAFNLQAPTQFCSPRA